MAPATLVSGYGSEMSDNERAMEMLFRAKWNVPQAAVGLGLPSTERSWEEVKRVFCDYCLNRLMDYEQREPH